MKQVTDPEELARHILDGGEIMIKVGDSCLLVSNDSLMKYTIHDVIRHAAYGDHYYPEATNGTR